jgi:hypothetical protein
MRAKFIRIESILSGSGNDHNAVGPTPRHDAFLIDTALSEPGTRRLPGEQTRLSPMAAILLPIACGLAGGYLDLVIIVLDFLDLISPAGAAAVGHASLPGR